MPKQLQRIHQFLVHYKPKLILGGLLGIALLSALLIFSPANALDGDKIVRWIFVGLFGLIGSLADLLSQLFLSIINSIVLPGQNSLIFGTQLESVWHAMLTVANSIFFIALFVFAILIITRQAGYNFKKAITTLIVSVVLANLSLEVIRLLIEAGDALRNTASSLIPGTKPEELFTWFNGLLFGPGVADIINNAKTDTGRTILLSFGIMAAEVAIMVALFKLMAVLVERAIRLAILAIFAPVQVAISILPQKELQSMGSSWLGDAIKWVLVLPVTFILVGVARMIMPSDVPAAIQAFLQHAADANGSVDTNFVGELFLITVGVGMVIAAGNSAALLKLPVAAAAKLFTGAADKAASSVSKWAGGEISANTKNAVFQAAQKTAVGRSLYARTAGAAAARKSQIESQAKQRELAVKEYATKISSSRFLNMQATFKQLQDNKLNGAAQAAGYATMEQWKKSPNKDQAEAAEKRIKDDLKRTKLGTNLAAAESDYMTTLGKASQADYELGRTPEETKILYEEAKAKWEKSGKKDQTAAFDMQKHFDVLKKQALRLPGDVGKEAADYRNEIAERDSGALDEAGLPSKFGKSKVYKEDEKRSPSGQEYVTLATQQDTVNKANTAFQAASGVVQHSGYTAANGASRQGSEIDLDIKSLSDETLRLVTSDDPEHSQPLRAELGQIGNMASLESLLKALPDKDRNKIERDIESIQARTDISSQDKGNLINSALENVQGFNANQAVANDRTHLAQALGHGLKLTEAGQARRLTTDINHSATLKASIQTEARQLSELRVAQEALKPTKDKMDAATPAKESYAVEVQSLKAAPPIPSAAAINQSNEEWLKTTATSAETALTKLLADLNNAKVPNVADLTIDQALREAGSRNILTSLTPTQLAEIARELNLQNLKPGKAIDTAGGMGENMSLKESMEMVRNIQKVS